MALSKILGEVELPPFESFVNDTDALIKAAFLFYDANNVQYLQSRLKKEHNVYSAKFLVDGKEQTLFIKRDWHNANNSGTQMLMEYLLTGKGSKFLVSNLDKGQRGSIIITEEAEGTRLTDMTKHPLNNPTYKSDFEHAAGKWIEKSTIIGLRDIKRKDVFWNGSVISNIDYGCGYGVLLGAQTRQFMLDDLFQPVTCYLDDPNMIPGRLTMWGILNQNIQKNASNIQELSEAFEDAVQLKIEKKAPLRLIQSYANLHLLQQDCAVQMELYESIQSLCNL